MSASSAESGLVGKETGPEPPRTGRHWPADTVERRTVASLVPYAGNARTHSPEQVEQLTSSIREFGWTVPVVIDEASNIIAGHGRVLAAQRLGLPEVPVVIARDWSEAQRRAYALADNRLPLSAGWDHDLLRIELTELKGLGVDLGLTGFGELELDALLDPRADDTDPDEAPEPPTNPVSRPGDLWICGEHRVLCGDATNSADVKKLLAGELADMCFTDPPYGVNYSAKDKQRGKRRPLLNDHPGEQFETMLRSANSNILEVTEGAVYVCMSSSELDTLQRAFRSAGGRWSTFVIWAKHTFTLGRADYQRQYEPILYGWKDGTDHFWCGARDQGDVWYFDKPSRNDLHPTMKPVALVERAIRNSSKSRDVILDPFSGSGTTMIAAERLGRRARLVELDPKYVDVAVQRWQTYAGGQATRFDTGETFPEEAARRPSAIDSHADGPGVQQ
ncbi:site-specific DNA-methyltransferase [Reyranella soli]|uniref:Methyltransferase n=1 Tax=Reyranella soli TaxID=1230389 RepID=A0A512NPP9_9HYPH|nr:site-specific DNA-methyltransferase [Reyranella soli]GEP60928.1 methyltransferase [Reyranella soli]